MIHRDTSAAPHASKRLCSEHDHDFLGRPLKKIATRMFSVRRYVTASLLLCGLLSLPAMADEGPLNTAQPKGVTSDQVIQQFAAKEKQFQEAREQYTYRQSVIVRTLEGDTIDGEYKQVFDVTFDNQGHKVKNVVFAPQSSLERIMMTEQDVDDIENRLPFVLTSDDIGDYDILYVGQQQQDELHCYVFDVVPKKIEGKKRYFQGRIWVDDKDLQIVKTYGKSVPDIRKKKDNENLFPKFTTYREQIDGKYWFPTYTFAEDTLKFSAGDVKVREIVRYTDYHYFGSKSKITYNGQEVSKDPGAKDGTAPSSDPTTSGTKAPEQSPK